MRVASGITAPAPVLGSPYSILKRAHPTFGFVDQKGNAKISNRICTLLIAAVTSDS
jgi:hypothetical protein